MRAAAIGGICVDFAGVLAHSIARSRGMVAVALFSFCRIVPIRAGASRRDGLAMRTKMTATTKTTTT